MNLVFPWLYIIFAQAELYLTDMNHQQQLINLLNLAYEM